MYFNQMPVMSIKAVDYVLSASYNYTCTLSPAGRANPVISGCGQVADSGAAGSGPRSVCWSMDQEVH